MSKNQKIFISNNWECKNTVNDRKSAIDKIADYKKKGRSADYIIRDGKYKVCVKKK